MHAFLAVEDELAEHVGRRLAQECGVAVRHVLGRKGNGFLRKRLESFRSLCQSAPVIVLTDLDRIECAPSLIEDWAGAKPANPPSLVFRVAVREIETWLLADFEGLAGFLKLKSKAHTNDVESLRDPKERLLQLARHSPSAVRRGIVRVDSDGRARQGPDYNGALGQFVSEVWDPGNAATYSDSLRRARQAIAVLSPSA